ncbi:MAG TPA: hypothetical protein DD420_32210, partial [Streptomyces sp.]|nr:hypothetical protein [Streptomyces sp.]
AGIPVPGPDDGKRLTLVKTAAEEVPAQRAQDAVAPVTNRDKVLDAVRDGARTNADIVARTGINKGSVSKLVKALTESGALVKDPAAGLLPGGAEEVSA